MIKTWWINNSWRFWTIRWLLTDDEDTAFRIWQEYRYMLDPADERSLVDLITQEYDRDTDAALRNPLAGIVQWLRALVNKGASS